MTVKGKNEITLDDILIGDVWFASGQSNMEMPLKGFPGNAVIKNSEEEIRSAEHKDIVCSAHLSAPPITRCPTLRCGSGPHARPKPLSLLRRRHIFLGGKS